MQHRAFIVLQPRLPRGSPSLFDMAPYVQLARAGARRTDFTLPRVVADRPASGQALHLNADFSTIEAQFDDPSGMHSGPSREHGWPATAAVMQFGSAPPLAEYLSSVHWPVEPASTGVPDRVVSGSQPASTRRRSRVMLTWLALHRLVRRPSRNSPVSLRSLWVQARWHASSGWSTTFPRFVPWLTIYATADPASDLVTTFWPSCASAGFKSWDCQPRQHPWGPTLTFFEAWGAAVGDWDAESILPSWRVEWQNLRLRTTAKHTN